MNAKVLIISAVSLLIGLSWGYSLATYLGADGVGKDVRFEVGERLVDGAGNQLDFGAKEIGILHESGTVTLYIDKESCRLLNASPEMGSSEDGQIVLGENIEQVGELQFVIPEGDLTKAMSNLEELQMAARVVPHYEGGEIVGYKLFRVKAKGMVSKLGLKNGDIIERVNGKSLKDPSTLMALDDSVKDTKHFQLDIQRRNQPVTLSYDIR